MVIFNKLNHYIEELRDEKQFSELKIQDALFKSYLNEDEKEFSNELKDIEDKLKINDSELYVDFISGLRVRWRKSGFKGNDGNWINPLRGGLCIKSIYGMLTSEKQNFLEKYEDYEAYEPYSEEDFKLINQLAWYDSPTSLIDSDITPYFTCLKLEKEKFPNEFYFYDSHFVYKLPFTNYESYFDALLASSAVECWQFFYIEPQELIDRNLGKNYFTVFLRSDKIENHSMLHYKPEIEADRLDIIHEHLELCVKALPEIFPKMDFSYHKNYFEKFNALYLESKIK